MENLSDVPTNTNSDAVSSIYSLEDLPSTKLPPNHLKSTSSILLFVVVVAAAASAFLLISNCSANCKNNAEDVSDYPIMVNRSLDPFSIKIAALYSEYKKDANSVKAPYRLEDYNNLYLTFIKARLLTYYLTGDQSFASVEYKKNRILHTVNVPIDTKAHILFYNGSLSTKPYFTNFQNLKRRLLPGQTFYMGLLTGKLADTEKGYCDTDANLCTILDDYNNNKTSVDQLLTAAETSQSTQTIKLPIYFVGVSN